MSIVDVLDSTHVDEQSLIVGVVGSPESDRGLRFASAMAVKPDVELVAGYALGMYSHLAGRRAPIEGHELEAASLLRDRWCARLDDVDGLRWSWQIVQGALRPLQAARFRQLANGGRWRERYGSAWTFGPGLAALGVFEV
jgi:hypothetical protein